MTTDKETVRKIAEAVDHLSDQERVDVLLSGAAMFALDMSLPAEDFIHEAVHVFYEALSIRATNARMQ